MCTFVFFCYCFVVVVLFCFVCGVTIPLRSGDAEKEKPPSPGPGPQIAPGRTAPWLNIGRGRARRLARVADRGVLHVAPREADGQSV